MRKLFSRGFTLIELMIVVVIMGILAAFAYPNYTRYIVESRRSDAQIGLTQLAALQEKFFSQCNSYTNAIDSGAIMPGGLNVECSGLGLLTSGTAGSIYSPNRFYTLAVAVLPVAPARSISFLATATPVAGTTQATDGKFSISNTGLKGWDRNNNNTWGETGENTWKKN